MTHAPAFTESTYDDGHAFPITVVRRVIIVLLSGLGALAVFVALRPLPTTTERTADRMLHAARGSASFDLGLVVSFLGSTGAVIVACVALAALVWLSSHRRTLTVLCLAGPALAGITEVTLKQIVGRIRPPTHVLTGASGLSFPSGHSSGAAAVAVVVVILARMLVFDLRARRVLVVAAVAYAVAVGISRVVVGSHYGLDVVGGWLCGAAAVLFVFVALTRDRQPSRSSR